MSGTGPDAGDGGREDGRPGDSYHGPSGVQRGSGNLQVNVHEHRVGIVSACAVALVCVATVIAVRVGGTGQDTGAVAPSGGNSAPAPATAPATARAPRTGTADPSALTGRLVNRDSGMCLRVTGTEDDLVAVQDTCTADADRTWTLAQQDGSGDTRTLRNAYSGRCLAVMGTENLAPSGSSPAPPPATTGSAGNCCGGAVTGPTTSYCATPSPPGACWSRAAGRPGPRRRSPAASSTTTSGGTSPRRPRPAPGGRPSVDGPLRCQCGPLPCPV